MAASTQGFTTLASTKYKGVHVDVLEGHIHEFKGTFIAFPIPTNNMIFNSRFSAKDIRARRYKFTVAQRVFEAASDDDGTGELSVELKGAATDALVDRERNVKVTRVYGLEPGVKKIIHVYDPSYITDGDDQDYLAVRLQVLWDTYTKIFDIAYSDENYVPGMEIAISPLSTELPDWRFPQPAGTETALAAIASFINNLTKRNQREHSDVQLPNQIAIVLPPPEGEDVREDRRDETFRQQLVHTFVTELPKQLEYSLAPPPSNVKTIPVSYILPGAPASSNTTSSKPTKAASITATSGSSTRRRLSSDKIPISEGATYEENNDHDAEEHAQNNDSNGIEDDQLDNDSGSQLDENNDDEEDPREAIHIADGEPDESNDNCSNLDPDDEEPDQFVDATLLPKSIISRVHKRVLIQLCIGDIAHFRSAEPKGPPYARILVSDAAIELDGNGGSDDEAIHAAAGPMLKAALTELKESEDYVNERAMVWTTGSFNLELIGVRRIIHAIGPVYHPRASAKSNKKKVKDLSRTYYHALCEAAHPENSRANMMVVFSLLSSKRNNFPFEITTRTAIESIIKFINHGDIGGINHIVFVMPRRDDARVKPFEAAMRKALDGSNAHSKTGERSGTDSNSDSGGGNTDGGKGQSNPNARTTGLQNTIASKSTQNNIKESTNSDRRTKRVGRKEAEETAAAAARVREAHCRLLREHLRETFRARALETRAQAVARQEAEAKEEESLREQLRKNLDNLYSRIAEEKKREREAKHAARAACEKVKEAATQGNGSKIEIVTVLTEKSMTGSGSPEDAPLALQTHQPHHRQLEGRMLKEAQVHENVAFMETPVKPAQIAKGKSAVGAQIPKIVPAATRSSARTASTKKATEESVADASAEEQELFLGPEPVVDTRIKTHSRTRHKRSREDVQEEEQLSSARQKKLKM